MSLEMLTDAVQGRIASSSIFDDAASWLMALKHAGRETMESSREKHNGDAMVQEHITVKKAKRAYSLISHNAEEEKAEECESVQRPAKKPKQEWKHGDRVRRASECQNKCT